jgi:hypothetical protein
MPAPNPQGKKTLKRQAREAMAKAREEAEREQDRAKAQDQKATPRPMRRTLSLLRYLILHL